MPSKYIRRRRYVPEGYGYYNKTTGVNVQPVKGFTSYEWGDYSTTSANIANWKRRIANLKPATTSLEGSRKYADMRSGYYSYFTEDVATKQKIETYRYGLMGYKPNFPDVTSLSTVKADNQAKTRFLKRAIQAQNHIQGAVSVGELAETLRMIRNPAKSLRSGIDDYLENAKKRIRSRRNVNGGPISNASVRRILADTWLEKAFGWGPLINDIQTGAETLARRRHEWRRETIYIRAGGSEVTMTNTPISSGVYGYLRTYGWGVNKFDAQVKYYGVIKREVYNDYAFDAKLFGFTPQDFLPTVWELIPYSFLVDYFTNIGDIINAYSHQRLDIAWCNKGVKKTGRHEGTIIFDDKYAKDSFAPQAWQTKFLGISRSDPKLVLQHDMVYRTAYEESFVPTIEFQIPDMGLKWLNLAALATASADVRRSIRSRG